MSKSYKEIAQYLVNGEVDKKEVKRVTAEIKPDLTVEEGYLVQEEIVKMKLAEGRKIIGPKMGLTSRAKMTQMNVEDPIYGHVFDYMLIENGGTLHLSDVIHPKVEAEFAFVIGEDIEGPGITGVQVMAATDYVVPALEIIDSRYENFDFTLPDVVADNASTSRVVFGNAIKRPSEVDLDLTGVGLFVNGEMKDLGAGAAVLGHPANSIAMLANMLAKKGEKVQAGHIILAGGITGAVMLHEGDHVVGKFDGFQDVEFKVEA